MTLEYDPDRIIECETGAEALQWEAAERIYAGTLIKSQRAVAQEIGKGKSHVGYMTLVWRAHLGGQSFDSFNEAYQAAKGGKREKSESEPSEPKAPDEQLREIAKRATEIASDLWRLSTGNPELTDEITWEAERQRDRFVDLIGNLTRRNEKHGTHRPSVHRAGRLRAVP